MTFQYPADKLVLSHSTRSSFRRCPRLLEFNKLFGDNKRDDDNFAAEVGKALHAGFQHYLIHKDEDKCDEGGDYSRYTHPPRVLLTVRVDKPTTILEASGLKYIKP